jgi:zinc transport system substrate-binding protein
MAAVAGVVALLATGCRSSTTATSTANPDQPTVVAAFYPLAYAAERVSGGTANVIDLTPSGVEPHDLELTAAQVAQIAEADLVLYVPGFQPAVDEAIAQQAPDRAIDVTAGLPMRASSDGAADPHVWLDPANMAAIGTVVADRLASVPTANAAAIAKSTSAFTADMASLDQAFTDGLRSCRIRDLVVSHEAFGYLADAYGLNQIGISGLSPDAEPSPARMKDVADLVRGNGVTTVYYETLVSPSIAQTLAAETGAQAQVLDPLEGNTDGSTGDYLTIMRGNLDALRSGQECA